MRLVWSYVCVCVCVCMNYVMLNTFIWQTCIYSENVVWPHFSTESILYFLHVPFIPTRNKFLKIFSCSIKTTLKGIWFGPPSVQRRPYFLLLLHVTLLHSHFHNLKFFDRFFLAFHFSVLFTWKQNSISMQLWHNPQFIFYIYLNKRLKNCTKYSAGFC